MGPQGSGKGTAAQELSNILKIPTISTGDLFRTEAASGSELGNRLKSIIDSGSLVPDELTVGILKQRLLQDDCKNGYMLDGFPRTMEQARLLENISQIDKVLYLDVDFDTVIERIGGRRTCPKCGHIHNVKFAGDPNYCSVCGTKYVVRADDTEEAIRKRLDTFTQKTLPIVEHFRQKGLVLSVDASRTPEYTLKQILKGLGK
ncbi:MAG: nucleoside monophosphate kinase [Clostridia bacterium]|nr:nucleoside monophosphate kinase [Clostridia bacterium]